ncbi:MAG: hypothetical protein II661_05935, partial [Bacteroidales bacterium]|nr:hypothetical protein [Bacteroidales bacterium]
GKRKMSGFGRKRRLFTPNETTAWAGSDDFSRQKQRLLTPETSAAFAGVRRGVVNKPFNKMCCEMAREREKCVFLYL